MTTVKGTNRDLMAPKQATPNSFFFLSTWTSPFDRVWLIVCCFNYSIRNCLVAPNLFAF